MPLVGAREMLGQAAARQIAEDGRPIGLQAGGMALPERRRGRERQQVGQEIGRLVHQIDAQLLVLDAGVDVHAADHQARGERLPCRARGRCSAPCRPALGAPVGERVGRRRDQRHAEVAARSRATAARSSISSRRTSATVAADAGADLDLGLEQLVGHAGPEALLTAQHEILGRRRDQVAAGRVDQQILLLDPEAQRRWGQWHGCLRCPKCRSGSRAWGQKAVRARLLRAAPPMPPLVQTSRSDPGAPRT